MGSFAREIIRAELLGDVIARKIAPPTLLKAPKTIPFPDPYQHKVVEAKQQNVTVYSFQVPEGCVGFIQLIGNNAFVNAYLIWRVDGRIIISPHIDYQIAPCNTPKTVTPWLRVNEEILWIGTNTNENLACDMEVLCDGFYTKKEDVEILLRMNQPIGE